MCVFWVMCAQPELYENPLFIAALDSVTSGLLTSNQAAEKFGIRESALTAAVSWCDAEQNSADLPTSSAETVSKDSVQVGHHQQSDVSTLSYWFHTDPGKSWKRA